MRILLGVSTLLATIAVLLVAFIGSEQQQEEVKPPVTKITEVIPQNPETTTQTQPETKLVTGNVSLTLATENNPQ